MIRTALISVTDKTGIVDLGLYLQGIGVQILSTGGTYQLLTGNGVRAIELSDYTQFPEMMGGRLKTLHPKIHGGILARRGMDESTMLEHGIISIDLVVVNLYDFATQVAKPDCTRAQAIEQIDIGGPAMLRSAAKNHKDVVVLCDPREYEPFMLMNVLNEEIPLDYKYSLAVEVFRHTAKYDKMVYDYLDAHQPIENAIRK